MTAEQFWQDWDDKKWAKPSPEIVKPVCVAFAEAYHRADAAAQLAEKEREIARLNNKCDLMIRQDREEVWYWADDGEDHPESLACPALIKPDVVRRFVAAEQRLQEVQAEIELLRHNRNEALKDEDDSF